MHGIIQLNADDRPSVSIGLGLKIGVRIHTTTVTLDVTSAWGQGSHLSRCVLERKTLENYIKNISVNSGCVYARSCYQ